MPGKGKRQVERNPVLDVLMKRRSVRKFQARKVEREVLETIVRAGQQAPFASQLASVVYATDGNFPFAAPVWFVICVDAHRLQRFMQRRGWDLVTNDLSLLLLGMQDAAYLAGNMVTAAESLGLGSCFLGQVSMKASRIKHLAERLKLPPKVLPMVELVMGYPAEEFPPRPRFPLKFTLFAGEYPALGEEEVQEAMAAMDEGYLEQGYYAKQQVKIPIEGGKKEDRFTFADYSWTEHISRKWGQWGKSGKDLLEVLRERGFDLARAAGEE
ncbi:MAG: hypothetical protein GX442_23860 [Candidatus Riflebacteria bacterium]|nr:hypothetical protein [Candidatus Riflebacteria bacterium]